ncbi:FUSC family protein [Frondihabitans sp. VKM Ac-2883]|uniref:FUSC family protein n=1 Tax=Frondihabitans sp. VKM Ac-2883 TaxID=2783823 RepID=UPI00188D792D|nr:FUSC family protein [Frondihabitans sp. VKM Ac-2883]
MRFSLPRAGGFDVRASALRVRSSLPAMVQIVLAAGIAYSIARLGIGHPMPILAVTVTISSLGFARDARPRRVLENAVGVVIGIALSELLLLVFGKGFWQYGIVLFVALAVARFLSPTSAFAIAAATQSMFVMLLPDPAGGPFTRSLDGLVGGAVALLITALVPRDPIGLARADARRLFAELDPAFASLVRALRHDDVRQADAALDRLRTTQPLLDDWAATLDTASSISRISPFLRRKVPVIATEARILRYLDLAVRNLRVVTRRIDTTIGDGRRRPEVADLVASIALATSVLGESLEAVERVPAAQEALVAVGRRLDPAVVLPGAPVAETVLVLMLRPLVIDLLMATGLPHDDARSRLAPL